MSFLESAPSGYRSGFVALIGRPNVGKSTLINQLVGEKVAITSPVAQTTRNRLKAILTTSKSQLVIVDTPGIHKPLHLLGERLVKSATSVIGEVDVILLILEGVYEPGRGDEFIIQLLKRQKIPVIVALNKWDLLSKDLCFNREKKYHDLLKDTGWNLLTCSALNGLGCQRLIDSIINYLPKGGYLYPPDMLSDQPERLLISELIREQILLQTREEVPHSVAVSIDRIDEIKSNKGKKEKSYTAILATVFVERKSQKGILIGKGGSMMKSVGKGARIQIQALIEGPVYLELFVKVVPNWRANPSKLSELGYHGNL